MIPSGPLLLRPLERPLRMTWSVPGSKSITNRCLVLAALAEGESLLEGFLESDDTRHMQVALQALGIDIERRAPDTLAIHGGRSRLRAPPESLYVGNSGTTVRFLTALACLVDGPVTLVGDEHMARRPITDLLDGLRQLGVRVDCETGCPPLTIHGAGLAGGSVSMRGDRSSQYFSALMLAGGLAAGTIDLFVEGELVSRPFVEITRRLIAEFGGQVESSGNRFSIMPIKGYVPRRYRIEPDATAASYAFALAAGGAGSITVPGLCQGALQGDYAFVDLLERAGAEVIRQDSATTVRGTGELQGLDVDMRDISDTVMTLAALSVVAKGPTRIRNIANIRIKETDRVAATVSELERLGQQVTHGEDWIGIEPRPVKPATIRCYSDHRMAMSFAVLGLLREGVSIEDPSCVQKTYPGFWDALSDCYRSAGMKPPW